MGICNIPAPNRKATCVCDARVLGHKVVCYTCINCVICKKKSQAPKT